MIRTDNLNQWPAHPLTDGSWALFWTIAAVALPTFLRASVQDMVSGCETILYVPAVLLAAVFLGWRYAAAAALASALVSDIFFMGTGHMVMEGPCDWFGMGAFLFSSATIIGAVELTRAELARPKSPCRPAGRPTEIVFSIENGEAWAGWQGGSSRVRLGPQEEVARMMEDFLAQVELAKYLASKTEQQLASHP